MGALRSCEIRGLVIFQKIRSVIPHKALGLILYLNFKKAVEDFAEQKAIKFHIIRFGLT
jgi:hypothetical protein